MKLNILKIFVKNSWQKHSYCNVMCCIKGWEIISIVYIIPVFVVLFVVLLSLKNLQVLLLPFHSVCMLWFCVKMSFLACSKKIEAEMAENEEKKSRKNKKCKLDLKTQHSNTNRQKIKRSMLILSALFEASSYARALVILFKGNR